MSRLKSIASTLISWLNCSKIRKTSLLILGAAFFVLFTAASPNVRDHAQIISGNNERIVSGENRYYRTTKQKPRLILLTHNSLNHLQPASLNHEKRTVYIVVGKNKKKGRSSVQIFSTADLHSSFTRMIRLNIVAVKRQQLHSSNSSVFNQGMEFVIRSCITQINQHYGFSNTANTLTFREQMQLNHPRRLRVGILAGLIVVIALFVFFYHKWRRPRPKAQA